MVDKDFDAELELTKRIIRTILPVLENKAPGAQPVLFTSQPFFWGYLIGYTHTLAHLHYPKVTGREKIIRVSGLVFDGLFKGTGGVDIIKSAVELYNSKDDYSKGFEASGFSAVLENMSVLEIWLEELHQGVTQDKKINEESQKTSLEEYLKGQAQKTINKPRGHDPIKNSTVGDQIINEVEENTSQSVVTRKKIERPVWHRIFFMIPAYVVWAFLKGMIKDILDPGASQIILSIVLVVILVSVWNMTKYKSFD